MRVRGRRPARRGGAYGAGPARGRGRVRPGRRGRRGGAAGSYTPLTLPTNRRVVVAVGPRLHDTNNIFVIHRELVYNNTCNVITMVVE